MASIGSILSTARTAITTHQAAVQISSNNISNVHTAGYSRRRALLSENPAIRTAFGSFGQGVGITDVSRARDVFLDAAYRRETSSAAQFGARRDLVGQIEAVFGEPSETGLASSLDAFWSSWSDLANNPSSGTAKSMVRQRGEQVASTLNSFSQRLTEFGELTRERLDSDVSSFNRLTTQLAEINGKIVSAETGGATASDLRDERDRLLDGISEFASVQTMQREDGSFAVLMSGRSVVDGVQAKKIELAPGTPLALRLEGSATTIGSVGGKLGAVLGVINTDLPAARAKLDTLADGIVREVNAVHTTGWAEVDGTWVTGTDFFTGTGASGIRLSAEVAGSAAYVAAGNASGATGNNQVALALAALREDRSAVGGMSFNDFYAEVVTGVGLDVDSAGKSATMHETLAFEADARRQSVSGVSVDEELVKLMSHQQAYMAATRLISAADEMTQAILRLV